MNQFNFKTQFWDSVIDLVKLTWLKMTGIYLLFMILIYSIIFGFIIIALASFGISSLAEINNLSENVELKKFMEDIVASNFMSSKYIITVFSAYIGLILIMLIPSAWYSNFMLQVVDDSKQNKLSNLTEQIKDSFNAKVFPTVLLYIIMYLLTAVYFGVSALLSATVSPFVGVIGVFLGFVLMFKFSLVIQALVLGNLSIADSFKFSFKHMTMKRCFKIFGYLIVLYVCLIVILFIVAFGAGSLMGGSTSSFGITTILQLLVQVALGGVMVSAGYSTLAGLYYRYAEVAIEEVED